MLDTTCHQSLITEVQRLVLVIFQMIEGIWSFSSPCHFSALLPPLFVHSLLLPQCVWVRERLKEIITKAEEHRMNKLGILKNIVKIWAILRTPLAFQNNGRSHYVLTQQCANYTMLTIFLKGISWSCSKCVKERSLLCQTTLIFYGLGSLLLLSILRLLNLC